MVNPQTPVIIGIAQHTIHRGEQPGPEPLEMWRRVSIAALEDAGIPDASGLDGLLLTDCMSWRYDDPASRLAEQLGASPRIAHVGPPSGTSGQTLLDKAATAIREGRAELVMLCGGEALATRRHYAKSGSSPQWSHPHPDGQVQAIDLEAHQHPGEVAAGLTEGIGAVYGFAMRDVARRAHLGIAPGDYRTQCGQTMAGLTRVAARNPDAWFGQERDAEFLAAPGQDNRMISYPYTKHMVAIIDVDISAAILIASEAWADRHGISRDRRVYPWASCYAEDPVYIAVRDKLWKSEAMAAAGAALLEAAELTPADIGHIDLYSCFPAAINFSRDALGIAERPGEQITVTGGLPYAGGPASSYVLTSIVKMTERLRDDPGAIGLVSGVGMMMSNHVYALYSTTPPRPELLAPDAAAVQARLDAIPQRRIDDSYTGPASLAAYTVMHGRDGSAIRGAAICDLPSGARSYATIRDAGLLERAEREELVGRDVTIARGANIGEIVAVN